MSLRSRVMSALEKATSRLLDDSPVSVRCLDCRSGLLEAGECRCHAFVQDVVVAVRASGSNQERIGLARLPLSRLLEPSRRAIDESMGVEDAVDLCLDAHCVEMLD